MNPDWTGHRLEIMIVVLLLFLWPTEGVMVYRSLTRHIPIEGFWAGVIVTATIISIIMGVFATLTYIF
jgi:hypothetical protein